MQLGIQAHIAIGYEEVLISISMAQLHIGHSHESRGYSAGRIKIIMRRSTLRKRTYMLQAPGHGPIAD